MKKKKKEVSAYWINFFMVTGLLGQLYKLQSNKQHLLSKSFPLVSLNSGVQLKPAGTFKSSLESNEL